VSHRPLFSDTHLSAWLAEYLTGALPRFVINPENHSFPVWPYRRPRNWVVVRLRKNYRKYLWNNCPDWVIKFYLEEGHRLKVTVLELKKSHGAEHEVDLLHPDSLDRLGAWCGATLLTLARELFTA